MMQIVFRDSAVSAAGLNAMHFINFAIINIECVQISGKARFYGLECGASDTSRCSQVLIMKVLMSWAIYLQSVSTHAHVLIWNRLFATKSSTAVNSVWPPHWLCNSNYFGSSKKIHRSIVLMTNKAYICKNGIANKKITLKKATLRKNMTEAM